ncbi:MAG: glycosyltransferase family 4 protein [Methanosarcinaceae archaeon]|nr:glycosyltransferase family 4 protein [Methanosarcinaceae archaeon]
MIDDNKIGEYYMKNILTQNISLHIIANAALGTGLSGGDRIFIELARKWAKYGHDIKIYVWEDGYEMCKRNHLENVNYIIWNAARYKKFGFIILYIIRTITGCIGALKVQYYDNNNVVYSSSDFLPDSIPALILKLRFKNNVKWIAGFYLFAPNPLSKESPYIGRNKLKGLFYYMSQLPVYWLIKRYADIVFVTSEPDVEKFITNKRSKDKIVVIRGGVDIEPSTKYLSSNDVIPLSNRIYDACFVGRFHYQKGVIELIDIWKLVCEKKPNAKLAMIGVGPLESEVKNKIATLELENNIDRLGFKDGADKYEIFKQSKIIVHPATYDSGGMAAAEGMAWGLPAVSFDLEALETYYPLGMIKTSCYDFEIFAENIVNLLEDEEFYQKIREDAVKWAKEWDWDKRAKTIMDNINTIDIEGTKYGI